jgi:hypothetical protein
LNRDYKDTISYKQTLALIAAQNLFFSLITNKGFP